MTALRRWLGLVETTQEETPEDSPGWRHYRDAMSEAELGMRRAEEVMQQQHLREKRSLSWEELLRVEERR
jgi:hypothetical protein